MARKLWCVAGHGRTQLQTCYKELRKKNHVAGNNTTTHFQFLYPALALLCHPHLQPPRHFKKTLFPPTPNPQLHNKTQEPCSSPTPAGTSREEFQRRCRWTKNPHQAGAHNASTTITGARLRHELSSVSNFFPRLPQLLQQPIASTSTAPDSSTIRVLGGLRRYAGYSAIPGQTHTIEGMYGTYQYTTNMSLGAGSFGTVFLGSNTATGEQVAIKTMENSALLASHRSHRVYVTREISAMMQMRHPYITQLYDVAYDPTQPAEKLCLIMEYMPGGTVHTLVSRSPFQKLSENEARLFFQQLIDAVTFCHNAGIIHRDLKPGNLLLDAMQLTLKVTDFGLSAVDVTAGHRFSSLVGTIAYMAPEVLRSGRQPGKTYRGPPADLWSCGVILFYLLSGGTPFEGGGRTRAEVEAAILAGNFTFPTYFSDQAKQLLDYLLDVDAGKRLTSREIYECPWFQKNYVPVDYRQIRGVQANLDAVEQHMRQPVVSPGATRASTSFDLVLPSPAQTWRHREEAVDKFTFGYGSDPARGPGQFLVDDTAKFYSALPAPTIVHEIANACTKKGYAVERRQFTVVAKEVSTLPEWQFREPLVVLIDVLELSEKCNVVCLRRVTGTPEGFQKFRGSMAHRCMHFMTDQGLPGPSAAGP